jgi:hypothetical protein
MYCNRHGAHSRSTRRFYQMWSGVASTETGSADRRSADSQASDASIPTMINSEEVTRMAWMLSMRLWVRVRRMDSFTRKAFLKLREGALELVHPSLERSDPVLADFRGRGRRLDRRRN